MGTRDTHWGTRGQSEVLGFVLVFSLMIIGALVVVGLGATAIDDTEQQLSEDRAEKTLTQFDSKAGLVALEEADSQRVSLPNADEGQFFVRDDGSWMAVVIENRSTGATDEIFNTSLGSMTYENGENTFAYQGGGLWRETENGGQMLSPPEFHYRNGTLTLPVINVTGESVISGAAVIKQNGTTKEFPKSSGLANETNPLSQFEVRVVVHSEYYRGWGTYFEERTDGAVVYDDSQNQAVLELVAPADYPPVQTGVFSGTAGTLTLGNNAPVTSYNSTTGTFGTGDGKVAVVGDLHLENNAEIYGNVEVGGTLTVDNNGVIDDGNISYGDSSPDISGCTLANDKWRNCVDNWIEQNASLSKPPTVDRLITEQHERLEDSSNNNNANVSDISGNSLSCASPCEIPAGNYYLDQINLNSQDLVFNTTGGNISVAVDGQINIDNQQMEVTGPNRVNVYANETFTMDGGSGTLVGKDTSDKPSTQFWLYMRSDQTATLSSGKFIGLIYGPGGQVNEGTDISLSAASSGCGNCELWGGVLGNIPSQVNNYEIHFDEALIGTEPVTVETTKVKITYLHITVNELRVES